MKRSRINPKSKKKIAADAKRAAISDRIENGKCEACKPLHSRRIYNEEISYKPASVRAAADLHEIVNRSQGGSTYAPENILLVCRPCHNWITEHPKEAEAIGLHLPAHRNKPEDLRDAANRRLLWGTQSVRKLR